MLERAYQLNINFWTINPKEHLWSRLRSLQLYQTTNILVMIYNADDRDSFDRLISIQSDFNEQNMIGAYQILVSVISPEIIAKKRPKVIKKAEVQ
jgi:hypothetical protein